MTDLEINALKIENQLCFPLYVASKEVINKYNPLLKSVGLTYTQYITMLALWEYACLPVKQLGDILDLDSGTITPVVKKLEEKGYVTRIREHVDERNVSVSLTKEGLALREKLKNVPFEIAKCMNLTAEEAQTLYNLLHKVIGK
ncbi:MAG: MarR family transcriptional regulator [Bacilli bacterium]|nr:MarR family transcriptional regulator [Bacilli bacterium]